jgi:non-homologous end joining protein Ku
MFRSASEPTRSNNSFVLAFGLINVPLAVYTGTEETRVARQEFVNGDVDRPVGRAAIDKTSGKIVESSSIVRMATATSGALVPLGDDEIAACTMPKGVAEVVAFVPLDELFQAYLTENVAQVRAKGDKPAIKAANETAFAVLLAGMAEKGVAALVKVSLRGPARYAAITPEGDLYTLYSADQVREPRDLPKVKVQPEHVLLACNLIETIGVHTPCVTDDTAAAVQEYVNNKAVGVAPVTAPLSEPNITDLMGQLSASIDAAKAAR